MQLRHIHERSATRCNFLFPKFTDIEFPIANARKGGIAVPRNTRKCGRQTFFATETANHTSQATVRTHAERIHLRKIDREQSYLRTIRLSRQRLRIFNKSLQVKIAIGVTVHNQEATTITLVINTLERPGSSQNIGQFHPDFFET